MTVLFICPGSFLATDFHSNIPFGAAWTPSMLSGTVTEDSSVMRVAVLTLHPIALGHTIHSLVGFGPIVHVRCDYVMMPMWIHIVVIVMVVASIASPVLT